MIYYKYKNINLPQIYSHYPQIMLILSHRFQHLVTRYSFIFLPSSQKTAKKIQNLEHNRSLRRILEFSVSKSIYIIPSLLTVSSKDLLSRFCLKRAQVPCPCTVLVNHEFTLLTTQTFIK